LTREDTGLLIVDVQSKLLSVMAHREKVIKRINQLIASSRVFDLPIILTEHYPQLLGMTINEVKDALSTYKPVKKKCFDCCKSEEFNQAVMALDRKYLILVGLETHICILQTAIGLIQQGYIVHVPQDAVSSRTIDNWQVGLDMMQNIGVVITSAETIIFQLLGGADAKEFKEIMKIIK
jgi:nicotinamidase-related amidase